MKILVFTIRVELSEEMLAKEDLTLARAKHELGDALMMNFNDVPEGARISMIANIQEAAS